MNFESPSPSLILSPRGKEEGKRRVGRLSFLASQRVIRGLSTVDTCTVQVKKFLFFFFLIKNFRCPPK